MALNAAFERDDRSPNEPGCDSPWTDWVASSKTRNYCSDDPLLDWLAVHGEAHGLERDDQRPDFDRRTDFRTFIFEKAARFEEAVTRCLAERCQLVTIRRQRTDVHNRSCVEATWRAMAPPRRSSAV